MCVNLIHYRCERVSLVQDQTTVFPRIGRARANFFKHKIQ